MEKSAPGAPRTLPATPAAPNLWKKALLLSLFATDVRQERASKAKEGETINDLSAFLTTEPNDVVAPVHPKAMPVIPTTEAKREAWMTAPAEEVLKLHRPLPDGLLESVATGEKEDVVAHEAA